MTALALKVGRLDASEVPVKPTDPDPADDGAHQAEDALRREDALLVEGAARGDVAAFETLYFRYRDWVANLAWRFTRDRDVALDAVQEVFAYLVRRIPTLRLQGRLTTFLYPAVKHAALGQLRRRRGQAGADVDSLLPDAPLQALEPDPGAPERLGGLRRAVAALPELQREVLFMRFVSGMSLGEIAIALDIPIGTVKSRLHAATAALAERAPIKAE